MTNLQTAVEALERNLDELSNNIDSESFMGKSLKEAYEALKLLKSPQPASPIPTVEEIADHIDLWFRTGEDKPWSFIVEDLAGSIHSLLTARLKGADHE